VWALARAGDLRCLPELRERLLGNRIGFATASVYFPRDAPMFDLPGMGLMVTRADPDAQLLDPVLSRLRRAARHADTLAGLLCETLGTWGEKAAAAVPELRLLLRRDHPAVFPSPAAAHALGRIGPAPTRRRQNCENTPVTAHRRRPGPYGGPPGTPAPRSTRSPASFSPSPPEATRPFTITETSGQATGIARAVLANPRRLASSGGWRTFDEDDPIHAAAAAYLASRATGQPG
jgi:hypothetical protein